VIAPAPSDEAAVCVVDVEVEFKLDGQGLTCVAAEATLLLLGKEVDGHPCTRVARGRGQVLH
jgi:hypothetical protein